MWRKPSISTAESASHRGSAQALFGTLGLTLLTCAGIHGSPASAHPHALTARTLQTTDSAKLHYLERKSEGSKLFEEGSATGTLPGGMHVYANIGPTLTATFTIYTSRGTIVGHARAAPHGSGRYESFAGSLVATGGSGSYSHAHGRAGFYGVLDRYTYNMTVRTTGALSY